MATLTRSYTPSLARIVFVKTRAKLIEIHKPRRCMVISVGMLLVGLSIPLLMKFELLPPTLSLSFVGFAMTATGSVLALILYGEL